MLQTFLNHCKHNTKQEFTDILMSIKVQIKWGIFYLLSYFSVSTVHVLTHFSKVQLFDLLLICYIRLLKSILWQRSRYDWEEPCMTQRSDRLGTTLPLRRQEMSSLFASPLALDRHLFILQLFDHCQPQLSWRPKTLHFIVTIAYINTQYKHFGIYKNTYRGQHSGVGNRLKNLT